jgi:hypothetical protein
MKAEYGLIAQEVAAVYPELVTRSATGEVQRVRYHELIPPLLQSDSPCARQSARAKGRTVPMVDYRVVVQFRLLLALLTASPPVEGQHAGKVAQ